MARGTWKLLTCIAVVTATGALWNACPCNNPTPLQQPQPPLGIPEPFRQEVPVPLHRYTKPLCKSIQQFTRRGTVVGLFGWNPAECELAPSVAFASCVRKKHLVFIGDSLGRELFTQTAIVLKAKPGVVHLSAPLPELEGCKPHKGDKSRECAIVSNSSYDAAAGGSIRFILTPVVTPEQNRILSSPYVNETLRRADYVVLSTGMWEMGAKAVPLADFIPWAVAKIELLKEKIGPRAVLVVFPHHWVHLDPKQKQKQGMREACNSPGKLALYRAALIEAAVCSGVEVFDSSLLTRHMIRALDQDGIH
ncbi:hypothetical protein DIPPA_61118, partial [Diplonema papillatum]